MPVPAPCPAPASSAPRVRFLPAGDSALVVQFGETIDRALSGRVLWLRSRVAAAELPGVLETVPTFRSLLVHYDPLRTAYRPLSRALARLLEAGAEAAPAPARRWRLPVCYAPREAPDLEEVARRTGLGTAEVVSLHAGAEYHVYMIGFLPGYPYMGDLPAPLVLPRRENPRLRVPPRAVAIATTLTAIYPLASPGGWHLIGTTPVRIFDAGWTPPALLAPGDRVAFDPVSAAEAETIRRDDAAGRYRVPRETLS